MQAHLLSQSQAQDNPMQAPSSQVSLFSPVPSDFFAWPPRSPSPATSGGSHHELDQQGLSSGNDRDHLHNGPSYQHAQLNHYFVPDDHTNGNLSNNGRMESQQRQAMEQDTDFQLDPEMVYLDAARLGVELELELGRQENDNKATVAAQYQQQLEGNQIHYAPQDHHSAHSDSTHHEHDDQDYHPEKQRGSKSTSGRQKKEGGPRMGRPKDYVWSFFQETLREDNGKHIAKCKACGWTAEWPKAFKIRVHLLACPDTPQNIKDAVQHVHDQQVECRENKSKEPKAAKRQYRKQNKEAPNGKKAKHDHPEESGASSNGDATHHDYSTDEGRRPSLSMSMSAGSIAYAANHANSEGNNSNNRQSTSHPPIPIFSHQPGSAGYHLAPAESKTINPQSTQLAPSSHDKQSVKPTLLSHHSAPQTSLPPITTANYQPAQVGLPAAQPQQTSAGLYQQQQGTVSPAIFSNHSSSNTFSTAYQPHHQPAPASSSLGTSPQSLPPLPPLASPDSTTRVSANRKRASSHSHETLTSPEVLQSSTPMAQPKRSPITCHVLDSSAGRPGANIKVRMDQLGPTGFSHVASGETDSDGRNGTLMAAGTAIDKNSIFKLTFYTREYFNAKNIKSFYPFVEVVFEVSEPTEHHHIALLLSPFSFTTYRGS